MKSYTDIEQSKKLAEFLLLESADYYHAPDADCVVTVPYIIKSDTETLIPAYKGAVPCWSLAALLEIIPSEIFNSEYVINITEGLDNKWCITYDNIDNRIYSLYGLSSSADNLIDACYEIILKLHEIKLL